MSKPARRRAGNGAAFYNVGLMYKYQRESKESLR
jgi:hypothetical protein